MDIRQQIQNLHEAVDKHQINSFLEEFQRESDRAAAILAVAYLDDSLKRLLTATVAGGKKVAERLLGRERPLGTYGGRALASLAFGLISRDEFHDVELIRAIRNDFAHEQHGLSFETPRISNRARNLVFADMLPASFREVPHTVRKRFDQGVAMLSIALLTREAGATRIPTLIPLWTSHRKAFSDAPVSSQTERPERS